MTYTLNFLLGILLISVSFSSLMVSHFYLQSSAMTHFACCGQYLISVLLVDQSGTTLILSWDVPGVSHRSYSAELQGAFPVLYPEKLLLVHGAYSQTRSLLPVHCLGHSLTSLYGDHLSQVRKSLWCGVIPCWGCLHIAARLIELLWMGWGQEHIGVGRSARESQGRVCNIAMFAQVCCGRGPRVEAWLEWCNPRRMLQRGILLVSYVASIVAVLVPAGICVSMLEGRGGK